MIKMMLLSLVAAFVLVAAACQSEPVPAGSGQAANDSNIKVSGYVQSGARSSAR